MNNSRALLLYMKSFYAYMKYFTSTWNYIHVNVSLLQFLLQTVCHKRTPIYKNIAY